MSIYDRFVFKNNTTVSIVYTKGALRRGRVEVIEKFGENQSITIDSLNPVYVGRQTKKCNLVISSMDISRVHCVIEFDDSKRAFIVTDCSTNGTFFNGSKLPKNIAVIFNSGTVLSLANDKHKIKLI